MKIAIIGASGKTGRHLVLESLKRGHRVVAVCRDASIAKLDEFKDQNGFSAITTPVVSDEPTLTEALGGFHEKALSRPTWRSPYWRLTFRSLPSGFHSHSFWVLSEPGAWWGP